jgi:pimeloyl-ACP methyl ester carboxylesterase
MKSNALALVIVCFLLAVVGCSRQPENGSSGRVPVAGSELAYEVTGNPNGETVLFIHGSAMADAFALLILEPALAEYRLVTYHRRGYGDSGEYEGAPLLGQQAEDALALLNHLNIDRAHLVGHSGGGSIALAIASAAPSRVGSIVSLEGAPVIPQGALPEGAGEAPQAQSQPSMSDAQERVELLMQTALDPQWRQKLPPLYPGVVEQVLQDALVTVTEQLITRVPDSFYEGIDQPVLYVIGENTTGIQLIGAERNEEFLPEYLPDVEFRRVAGMGHVMQILYPQPIAELIADWLRRHPIE